MMFRTGELVRCWHRSTGEDAVSVGLIDEVGGLYSAINARSDDTGGQPPAPQYHSKYQTQVITNLIIRDNLDILDIMEDYNSVVHHRARRRSDE